MKGIRGKKPGRENDEEFIYFNSVGLSFIDLNYALYIYNSAKELGLGKVVVLCSSDIMDYYSIIY